MFEAIQHAPVIDPGYLVNQCLIRFFERWPDISDTRIEHNGVELAATKLDRLLEGISNTVLVRYVDRYETGTDLISDGSTICDVGNNNGCTLGNERLGNGTTDARCTSRYKGAFVRQ